MDPELKKGFEELQAQVLDTRSRIRNIETCQKFTSHYYEINRSVIKDLAKDGDINDNVEDIFFYQQVGRMLVKREGKAAVDFLLERQEQYLSKLKECTEVKEVCLNRVKESENSLRQLVNKKLNKTDQSNKNDQSTNESEKVKKVETQVNVDSTAKNIEL